MYINIHFDQREAPEFFNHVYKGQKKLLGLRWNNLLIQFPSRKSAIKAATEYKNYVIEKGYRSVPRSFKDSVFAYIGINSREKEAKLQTARQLVDFCWHFPSE